MASRPYCQIKLHTSYIYMIHSTSYRVPCRSRAYARISLPVSNTQQLSD